MSHGKPQEVIPQFVHTRKKMSEKTQSVWMICDYIICMPYYGDVAIPVTMSEDAIVKT